ncbi:hypothetical protein KCMC57_up50160 [Kitasatospora sp. CMC57]|uniref:Uncharacterized protein n=1 Tax=Kitasatospora sp. CMC57 TaxID=3231513 RepID=A0AB33K324_9ACTN
MELGLAVTKLARRRVRALCLALVVLGSPWIQREFDLDRLLESETQEWLWTLLRSPGWWITGNGPALVWAWSQVVGAVVVLVTVLALVPRSVPLHRGRPALLVACLGVGGLAGVLSGLSIWAVLLLGDERSDRIFVQQITVGLSYGLVIGLLLTLALLSLATGPEDATAPATARKRERSTVMAEYQRPNSTPLGSAPGDVTRYVSAAVYTDDMLADSVVEHLVHDEFGAVAASPAFDLVPVARHSIAAQGLRRRRDSALALVFGVILLFAPLWLLFAWLALRALSRSSPDTRTAWTARGRSLFTTPYAVVRLAAFAVPVFGIGLTLALLLGSIDPGGLLSWLLGSWLMGIPAFVVTVGGLLAAYLLTLRHILDVDARLRGQFRREVFRPDLPVSPSGTRETQLRLAAFAKAQRGNLTIYSGYNPFVGFSRSRGSWNTAVALLPAPARPGQPARELQEFDVWELVSAVRRRLQETSARHAADQPGTDETDLSVLQLQDRVFANGAALAGNDELLPPDQLSPAFSLPEERVREIALNPTGVVRHYLAAHLPLWGGDVVPSLFLHMSTDGRTMHIQAEQRILAPVHAWYHEIDLLPAAATPTRLRILRLAGVGGTARALFGAPRAAYRHATAARRRRRRRLHELVTIEQSPGFDYGAAPSVREAADSGHYQNYFQQIDANRAFDTLDRHAFAAMVEFLDEHGVDTSELRQQQQTILNHGVIQQGGISVVGNQAVGQGATAQQYTPNLDKTP